MRRLASLGALALSLSTAVACASHDGEPAAKPKEAEVVEPTPDPEPPREPVARALIASVQMIEDCPDDHDGWRPPPAAPEPPPPPAQPAADEAPAQRAARPAPGALAPGAPAEPYGDSPGGWKQPCTQSTMQVVFSGQGDVTSAVEIEAVRLLDPASGKEVARLQAREPAAWRDGAYQSWDETIGPRQEVKASYELSVPEWSAVETAIGTSNSFGHMFLLELDVTVGDERQTVRSPQFPREQPHVIVT